MATVMIEGFSRITDQPHPVGTYSCNVFGEVWRSIGAGHSDPDERDYLQGQYAALDRIVCRVLEREPGGARFRVYPTTTVGYWVTLARARTNKRFLA